MFRYFNPNPYGRNTGDCTVRALCKALRQNWDETYWGLCEQGYYMGDMPSANAAWGAYLQQHGFTRRIVPNDCPTCYTVADFAREFPHGTFVVASDGHVVCVKDGVIYDTWDSADKTPLYYWYKED